MRVFFVIILSTICVDFVRSAPPSVICEYSGTSQAEFISPPYKFVVADVPDRCEVVVYGEYDFKPPEGTDASAIKELLAAGKSVYMAFECPEIKEWAKIIDDPKLLDKHMEPALSFLKENNKVAGVILTFLNAFKGVIQDYATKINGIICKIKECLPSAKIGLLIEAVDSSMYSSAKDFDFTVTNDHVDMYIINLWSIQVDCQPNLSATGGRFPINSTDSTEVISLTKLCNDVNSCPIDKSKIIVNTINQATLLDKSGTKSFMNTYSKYCSHTDPGEVWCPDSIQLIYDQIIFLKKTFKGIMITYLETDDTANTCGCSQKFPVANTKIDALEGKPIKLCDKIS